MPNLEYMFCSDVLKELADTEASHIEAVTSHLLEEKDYAYRLGAIREIRQIREFFNLRMKEYFKA